MKMNYEFNPITGVLTASAAFLKNAEKFNSPEYCIIRRLKTDYGKITIQTAKSDRKAPVTIKYEQMKKFIAQCRDAKERLEQFERVRIISKLQNMPYQYMVNWFLTNYANYSEQPCFDADGFLIVKTKAEMEAAGKTAANDKSNSFDCPVAV